MSTGKKNCTCVYILGALGTLLVAGAVVYVAYSYTKPADLSAARAAERRNNLAVLKQSNAEVLHSYGWVDQTKGVVRLPVERAVELTLQEWQNPAEGRKKLIARLDKANVPAPKPPETKSEYE